MIIIRRAKWFPHNFFICTQFSFGLFNSKVRNKHRHASGKKKRTEISWPMQVYMLGFTEWFSCNWYLVPVEKKKCQSKELRWLCFGWSIIHNQQSLISIIQMLRKKKTRFVYRFRQWCAVSLWILKFIQHKEWLTPL